MNDEDRKVIRDLIAAVQALTQTVQQIIPRPYGQGGGGNYGGSGDSNSRS